MSKKRSDRSETRRRKRKAFDESIELFEGWTQCPCGMKLPPEKPCPVCASDGTKKKAGIAIDRYKLATFSRILESEGFEFVCGGGIDGGTYTLYVVTDEPQRLMKVVARCNSAATIERN